MRRVILHLHLFKNAGTSLDSLLQENFPGRWVTREFSMGNGENTDDVQSWILDTPKAIAFSSHTIIGPLPSIPGIQIVPVLFLRDPLERIVSAYHFERAQDADTYGARLAKRHDLAGYVQARLARPGDRQCRNFQTSRLASMIHGNAPERPRALRACDLIRRQGVLGLVHQFDRAITELCDQIAPIHPGFNKREIRANSSSRSGCKVMAHALQETLKVANEDDHALLDYAQRQLNTA
ncbi:MAG: hypothetical protein AAF755_01280 [Pseudomonadota bacterium]